jgi:NTE family protein
MRQTLATVCDFERLNDASNVRISITATNVASGNQVTFSNYVAKPDAADVRASKVLPITLTPDHILASGSLPPGFPMTVIDGVAYWDGGLFDNTPIEALLDLLDDTEIDQLPIFVVNLFPTGGAVPRNLIEVQERMLEISYENRFWAQYEGPDAGLGAFTDMLEELARALPPDAAVRTREPFRRMQRLRALKNLKFIQAAHAPMSGGSDFSAYGVHKRFDSGYAAVDKHFANPTGS